MTSDTRVVPLEPTLAMTEAALDCPISTSGNQARAVWKAMLSATPSLPLGSGDVRAEGEGAIAWLMRATSTGQDDQPVGMTKGDLRAILASIAALQSPASGEDRETKITGTITATTIEAERERIARIIDPVKWRRFDHNEPYFSDIPRAKKIEWTVSLHPSLAKADAILNKKVG